MRKYIWMVSFLLVFACKCDSGEVSTLSGEVKRTTNVASGEKATQKTTSKKAAGGETSSLSRDTSDDLRGGGKASDSKSTMSGTVPEGDLKKEMEKGDYYVDNSAVKMPDDNRPVPKIDQSIPRSCDLLGEAFMVKEFNIKDGVLVNDASNPKSPSVKSCFFRWDNGILVNSGIYVQVMGNPVPDEVSDYALHYINGKMKGGEMDMSGTNYQYKKFDIVGDDGAYSAEQGRYYWREGKELVFMLAFNLGMGSNTEHKHAKKLAVEIMKNYEKLQKMKSY